MTQAHTVRGARAAAMEVASSGAPRETCPLTFVDQQRVGLAGTGIGDAGAALQSWGNHIDVGSFAAGSSTYVSPTGELIVYVSDHGDPVFGEYRQRTLVRPGSPTLRPTAEIGGQPFVVDEGSATSLSGTASAPITKAWVQLFEDPGGGLQHTDNARLNVEYDDRALDQFGYLCKLNLANNWVFDPCGDLGHDPLWDRVTSLRWFARPVQHPGERFPDRERRFPGPGLDPPWHRGVRAREQPRIDPCPPATERLDASLAGRAAPGRKPEPELRHRQRHRGRHVLRGVPLERLAGPRRPLRRVLQRDVHARLGPRRQRLVRSKRVAGVLQRGEPRRAERRDQECPRDTSDRHVDRGHGRPDPRADRGAQRPADDHRLVCHGHSRLRPGRWCHQGARRAAREARARLHRPRSARHARGDRRLGRRLDLLRVAPQPHQRRRRRVRALACLRESRDLHDRDDGHGRRRGLDVEDVHDRGALAPRRDRGGRGGDRGAHRLDVRPGGQGGAAIGAGRAARESRDDASDQRRPRQLDADDPVSAITKLRAAILYLQRAEARGAGNLKELKDLLGLVAEAIATGAYQGARDAILSPSPGQAKSLESIADLIFTGHDQLVSGQYLKACDSFRQANQKSLDLLK